MYVSMVVSTIQLQKREVSRGHFLWSWRVKRGPRPVLFCAVPRRHIKIEKRLQAFFSLINPNERFGFPSLHGGFRKPFDEFVNLILRLTFEMPERPENYRNAVQTAFRKVGYRLRSRGFEYVE